MRCLMPIAIPQSTCVVMINTFGPGPGRDCQGHLLFQMPVSCVFSSKVKIRAPRFQKNRLRREKLRFPSGTPKWCSYSRRDPLVRRGMRSCPSATVHTVHSPHIIVAWGIYYSHKSSSSWYTSPLSAMATQYRGEAMLAAPSPQPGLQRTNGHVVRLRHAGRTSEQRSEYM